MKRWLYLCLPTFILCGCKWYTACWKTFHQSSMITIKYWIFSTVIFCSLFSTIINQNRIFCAEFPWRELYQRCVNDLIITLAEHCSQGSGRCNERHNPVQGRHKGLLLLSTSRFLNHGIYPKVETFISNFNPGRTNIGIREKSDR